MSIREAVISDLETVKRISEITMSEIYPHYYPKGAVEFFMAHHSETNILNDIEKKRAFLCLDAEQNAVGTVTIKDNEICRLFVLPACQGKGYGTAMLDYAEAIILSQYSEIVLDASLPAKRIYQKRGYENAEFHTIETSNNDFLCYDVMVKKRHDGHCAHSAQADCLIDQSVNFVEQNTEAEIVAKERENMIRRWFSMWLQGKDTGITDIFAPNAVYIESWGPEYHGSALIRHWFEEWNTRGKVRQWDIRQFFHYGSQTVVQWYFKCSMNGVPADTFDGMSLVQWSRENKICFLQEFGCNEKRYNPYAKGEVPVFRDEKVKWF